MTTYSQAMPAYSQADSTIRKTFNISEENALKMKKFLSPRKQTEFVNLALEHEFAKIERQQKLQALSLKVKNIKRIKASEPVVEALRKMRIERDSKLTIKGTSINS